MSQTNKTRTIIRSQQLNLNLQNLLNNILMSDFSYPVCQKQTLPLIIRSSQIILTQNKTFIGNLGCAESLISTLKFLKLKEKKKIKNSNIDDENNANFTSFVFCRPFKHATKDEKVFWLMKNKQKSKMNLDNPKAALVLPNNYLIAIERKYINLYQIEENLGLSLKDFDSNGLGKKFTFTEIKHVNYKGRDYALIFGNQKYQFKAIFLVLVFEVSKGILRFVKRAVLAEKQVVSPTIIFEYDPSSKDEQKLCLILGGCCDNFQTYHYSALKVNLHILLSYFLEYDVSNTCLIPFNKKVQLLSGKAINFKQAWYCFCSEQQTINQIVLQYGGPGKLLTTIGIQSEKLNFKDKIFFSQDSLHYVYEAEEDRIVFIDKNMDMKQRSLNDIIYKFKE